MLELVVQLASEFLKFCLCDNYWHNDVGDDNLVFSLNSHYPLLLKIYLFLDSILSKVQYGIDRQIWTGKSIIEVVNQRWNIQLKDSRIYDILKEIGLSHQKAHRDYENADQQAQQEFITTIKKN